MHIFALWQEAREPGENLGRHGGSRQTAHREAPASWQIQTQNLCAVRRQCSSVRGLVGTAVAQVFNREK